MKTFIAVALAAAVSAQPLFPVGFSDPHDHRAGQIFFPASAAAAAGGPEQLWLAFGATPDVITVSWLTNGTGAQTVVSYGTVNGTLDKTATGAPGKPYTCGSYTSGAIHQVTLSGLAPKTTYFYSVGAAGAASTVRSFVSSPGVGAFYPYTFAAIGDLGQTAYSADTLAHVSASSTVNSAFLSGDVSYADGDQPRWDSFQRMADTLASSMPFMVASGNHEIEGACLYEAYQARFASMPAGGRADGPLYYSYEVGPAHVIVLASFFVYSSGSAQYNWLQADLAKVDRTKTPWLLVIIHAPWYNSNSAHQGDGELMRQTLEPMLHAAKVNMVFAGHVHAYERSFAVNNKAVDPTGAIHITIGDGGNREGLYTKWVSPQPSTSAFRQSEYGHGELTITSATTATWTWIRNADPEPKQTDSVTITNIAA